MARVTQPRPNDVVDLLDEGFLVTLFFTADEPNDLPFGEFETGDEVEFTLVPLGNGDVDVEFENETADAFSADTTDRETARELARDILATRDADVFAG